MPHNRATPPPATPHPAEGESAILPPANAAGNGAPLPVHADAAGAHAHGLVAEAELTTRQILAPGAQPAGRVGLTAYYAVSEVEPLHTRKEWKNLGRRVASDALPSRELVVDGQPVTLFTRAQTISPEAHRALLCSQLEEQMAAWRAEEEALRTALADWLARLPDTPAPQAEEALRALLEQEAGHQQQRQRLEGPARQLGLTPPADDPAPWRAAQHAYRRHRLAAVTAETEPADQELIGELHRRLLEEESRHGDPAGLFSYWKFYGRFHKALEESRFAREVSDATRIHEFHALFPARAQRRQFTLYLGPTNSGKTYQALQRLARAANGCYLAPLRLLALEVSETLREWGVPCSMVTGEERIIDPLADHVASTIEMLSLQRHYQMCVIDEAQMLGDPDRGWAWTQAILGVQAEEVAVIGAPEALPAIEKLLALTGDPYEVVRTQRLTPLELLDHPVSHFHDLEPGTALIAFSRAGVLHLKGELEHHLGKRVAVVYGALPPEVRREQARLFASGEAPYLVATDAIGMGLNLPIRTILFSQDRKLIDQQEHPLTPMEVRQIGGRAGRFGKNEVGFIGTFRIPPNHIRTAFHNLPKPITRAHLAPNLDHLLAIAQLQEQRRPQLAKLFTLFVRTVRPDPQVYRLSELEDQLVLARITDHHPSLDLPTRFALSAAPVPLRTLEAVNAFELMVETVARQRALPLAEVLPTSRGRTERQLGLLEASMQVVNLYCWLHYRFPKHFPELAQAVAARRQINSEINALLGRERKLGRQCNRCDAPLPPLSQHPHPICDACFSKGRRQGEGEQPPRPKGDWRRHLPARTRAKRAK